jgi:hypothetical protein
MQFLDHWDLNRGELRNAKAHILAGFTGGLGAGDEGLMAFDSTAGQKLFGIWNGSAWIKLRDDWVSSVAAANDSPITITGTQALTLDIALANGSFLLGNGSHLARATLKSAIPISGFGTAMGHVAMGSYRITGLGDPVDPQDAATRAYVDSVAQGLAVKQPVKAATTGALPAHTRNGNFLTASANGALPNQDGVMMYDEDRLLVKDQPGETQSENGIYRVAFRGDASTPWCLQRADDADSSEDVISGMYCWVDQGTAHGDSAWVLATNNPIVLNTTPLKFVQFSAAADVAAGNGLVKSANTLHFGQSAAYTTNTIPLATGSASIGFIGAGSANQVLRIPGAGGAPAFGAINLAQAAAVTGLLAAANGGTGQNTSAWTGYARVTAGTWSPAATIAAADVSGVALTKTDDTNVTLMMGGTPATALVAAVSLTLGWTGQLAIARGGTGQATAAAAFDALSPLTTLGDLLYGSASGAGTRLAGNTSATKKYLSQTGDGAASAAPVWAQIAIADISGNPTTGTGTINVLSKWTTTGTTLGVSSITDDAGAVTFAGLVGTGTRILSATAAGLLGALANGADGTWLKLVTGAPAWTALTWSDVATGRPADLVTGGGTSNRLAKWTGTHTVGDSSLFDNGTQIALFTATPRNKCTVQAPSGGAGASATDGTGGVRVCWSTGFGLGLDAWDSGEPRWGLVKYSADSPTVILEGVHHTNEAWFRSGSVGISALAGAGTRLALASATGLLNFLANSNSSVLVTSGAGVVSWATDLPAGVTIGARTIARKATVNIPAGSEGNVDITHNLSSYNVMVMLRRSNDHYAMTTFKAISTSQVRLTFASATTEPLLAVIIG